jgi:hypothetical protein
MGPALCRRKRKGGHWGREKLRRMRRAAPEHRFDHEVPLY